MNNYIYVGSSENIVNRLKLHNQGKIRSTKAYRPWILCETRSHGTRAEAVREETFLKSGQQKELLRKKYVA